MARRGRGPGLRHRWQRRLQRWLGHQRPDQLADAEVPAPLEFAAAADGPPRLLAYLPQGAQGWILEYLWRDLRAGMEGLGPAGLTLASAATPAELAAEMAGRDAYVLVMFQGHLRRLLREGVPPDRLVLYYTHVRLGLALPALQQLHAVLVLNAFEQALVEMQGVAPTRVHRFPAGYDPTLFHPPVSGHPRPIDVLFVGRYQPRSEHAYYHRRKRFPLQAALANRLVQLGVSVTILGEGWEHCAEPLDSRVERLQCDHARYGEIYRQARLVCSVSAQEGGPVSFLEALACGCQLLSTPTGFALDCVSGQEGITLLPLTASLEQWLETIQACLDGGRPQEPALSAWRQAFLQEADFRRLGARLLAICFDPMPLPLDLPGIPPALLDTLRQTAAPLGIRRLALVGGAVRDALLHHEHRDPWRGLPDLDLVLEGSAPELAEALRRRCGRRRVPELRAHGAYGTVELALDGVLLDLAGARQEHYPAPGHNPVVEAGPLERDLERRDFTVNAMALELPLDPAAAPRLLDPHGGRGHLARRELAFLHASSVADDPTRVLRAARYAARLGFVLAPEAMEQLQRTLAAWPWSWRPGDRPEQAPPALATRLRMELELLLEREPWGEALTHLQAWGALVLLDPGLQRDSSWRLRLLRARRLGVPLLTALVAGAADPLALAARLQLPLQQQRDLEQWQALRGWLATDLPAAALQGWTAADWSRALEGRPWPPQVVALAVCALAGEGRDTPWRPLLRWWGRWRHLKGSLSARELIASGWLPGPALGAELERLRQLALREAR